MWLVEGKCNLEEMLQGLGPLLEVKSGFGESAWQCSENIQEMEAM